MELGLLTGLFNVLSLHLNVLYGYATGILFAWSVSLMIDFFHLKKLAFALKTKPRVDSDLPAAIVICLAFVVNLLLVLYVSFIPNHLMLEIVLIIQFWLYVGLLRTTEIVYKSLLFIAPTSKQMLHVYSWRYLFYP